jgi:3-phenylpropionate/cinnamic acid dioxygenase small subunit
VTPEDAAVRLEIAELLQRYGAALDERRFDLLDRVFTPDAELHYRMGEQETRGDLARWKTLFRDFLRPFHWTQHVVSVPQVELEGERALATSRLIATHVQIRRRDATRSTWTVYGVYRDELARTASGWRIRRRSFESAHADGAPLPPDEVAPE